MDNVTKKVAVSRFGAMTCSVRRYFVGNTRLNFRHVQNIVSVLTQPFDNLPINALVG
jgi:hypothetical protein